MVQTNLSVLSGVTGATGASVMPEKRVPRKKIKNKTLATLPPQKDPIQNQDKNTLDIEKDQILPPHVPQFPPVFKSLRNEANDDNHEY